MASTVLAEPKAYNLEIKLIILMKMTDNTIEHVIQISNISKSGSVHVPIEILKKLKINGKGRVVWIERDGEILVRKLESRSFSQEP